jgi:hypothetical protein
MENDLGKEEQANDVHTQRNEKPEVEPVKPGNEILRPDFHPEFGVPSTIWTFHTAEGLLHFYTNSFDHEGGKDYRPLSYAPEKMRWHWQFPNGLLPPYRLPDILAKKDVLVVVPEGEKASDAAAVMFPEAAVTTSACGAQSVLRTDWACLKGRDVIVAPDKGDAGMTYAMLVSASALVHSAKSVRLLNIFDNPSWATGDDLAHHAVTADFLDSAVDIFEVFDASRLEPHIVNAAAKQTRSNFDRLKKTLADSLGIGVRTFESMVKEARARDKEAEEEIGSSLLADDQLEPWGQPVDGDILFAEIISLIKRFVVLTDSQAVAVACWIIFSYGFDVMRICPKLLINSASKRCGKSTLLELILYLVPRALAASNLSAASIYRSIHLCKPTLLIDEADTYLNSKANSEMVGIINSGHNKSMAWVMRIEEADGKLTPVRYSTFCPQVIAMIKTPSNNIIDRSIIITLQRKLEKQMVDALAIDSAEQFLDTRRRILRWIEDHIDHVHYNLDTVPALGNDRARQNWAVLAAFSQALGVQAHVALLKAASELSDTSYAEDNLEVDLLSDIRDLLCTVKQNHVHSAVIIMELVKMKDRPWGELTHGKPINENRLARLLKPFKIEPTKFRDGAVTQRGYSVASFNAVFDRYLSGGSEVSA